MARRPPGGSPLGVPGTGGQAPAPDAGPAAPGLAPPPPPAGATSATPTPTPASGAPTSAPTPSGTAAGSSTHPDLMADAEKQRLKRDSQEKEDRAKKEKRMKEGAADAGAQYNIHAGFIDYVPVDVTVPEYDEYMKAGTPGISTPVTRVFTGLLPPGLYKHPDGTYIRFDDRGRAMVVPAVDWDNLDERKVAIKKEIDFLRGQGHSILHFTFGRSDEGINWDGEPWTKSRSVAILVEKMLYAWESNTTFVLDDANVKSLIQSLKSDDLAILRKTLSREDVAKFNHFFSETKSPDLIQFFSNMEKYSNAFRTKNDMISKVVRNVGFEQYTKEINGANVESPLPAAEADRIAKHVFAPPITDKAEEDKQRQIMREQWLASPAGAAWLATEEGKAAVEKNIDADIGSIEKQLALLEGAKSEMKASIEGFDKLLDKPKDFSVDTPEELMELIEGYEAAASNRNKLLNVVEEKQDGLLQQLAARKQVLQDRLGAAADPKEKSAIQEKSYKLDKLEQRVKAEKTAHKDVVDLHGKVNTKCEDPTVIAEAQARTRTRP